MSLEWLATRVVELQLKPRKALPYAKAAIAWYPNNYIAWFNLGVIYQDLAGEGGGLPMLREAVKCYEKTLAINPKFDAAIFNLERIKL